MATKIYNRYGLSVWMPSKGNNEENAMQMSKGDFRTVLYCARQCIKSIMTTWTSLSRLSQNSTAKSPNTAP